MIVFHYDKTFEGLLTAIFDSYFRRTRPAKLLAEGEPEPLFVDESHLVITQDDKAARVWRSVEKKLDKSECNMVMHAWLSEEPGSDELVFRFLCKVIDSKRKITTNYNDADVLEIQELARKVSKEARRMFQFVRFQKAADGTYFAPVEPLYNALPLAVDHFIDRFADQKWLIYDVKRRYGFYYDMREAVEVRITEDGHLIKGILDEKMMAEDEKLFQELWKRYFKALSIKERYNPRLQRQNMPRRFWKYLTEKQ